MAALDVPAPLAVLAALASNVSLLLLVFLAMFAVAAARGRWRHAFTTMIAGPALFGFLSWLHAHLPAAPPTPPPFPLVGGWGSIAAALGVSLATVVAWRARCNIRACLAWSAAAALLAVAPALAATETLENAARGAFVGFLWAGLSIVAGLLLHALLAPDPLPVPRPLPVWDRVAT